MTDPKPENRTKSGRFAKGHSGNPGGRPKDAESWSGIFRLVGEMYPEDILAFVPKTNALGRVIAQLPKNVQIKYLVAIRAYSALLFEPTSGLLTALIDRIEGKVESKVDVTSGGQPLKGYVTISPADWETDKDENEK